MKLTRTLVGASVAAALSLTGLGHAAFADPPSTPDPSAQSAATAAGTATGIPLAVPLSATQKVADWQSLQFGLFMHWGVYSTYEGMYQGRPQRMGYPEQIKVWEKIPDSDYKAQAATMTADKWDAANVCQTAKNTGMKYVMITTKHHDGFAMWDTKTTDYNVVKATAFGRDPMKELSEECGKIGIKLAFYYSIIDWSHQEPEPYANRNKIDDFMMTSVIKPQLTELLTDYGPIAELWFDMGDPTAEQSQQMAAWVHELQPATMVNSRVWNKAGDFEVGGDNQVGTSFKMEPWESILSIFPQCWSYCTPSFRANRSEENLPVLINRTVDNLVNSVASNGQFDFNVGPKGDGSFDPFDQKVLDGVGQWMGRHPDAITGARPTWLPTADWGRTTTKGNDLFMFPASWEDGKTLTLTGVGSTVASVGVDGTGAGLSYTQEGSTVKVTLSGASPDEVQPVVRVSFASAPQYAPEHTLSPAGGESALDKTGLYLRRGPQGGTAAVDTYVSEKEGKSYEEVTLSFQGELDAETTYKVAYGDKSIEATGAQLLAGPVGEGWKLPAGAVVPVRLALARPSYYGDSMSLRGPLSVTLTASEKPLEGSAPVFTKHPQSVEARDGERVALTAVAASRPAATYQWYRRAPGASEASAVDGATGSVHSFTATMEDNGAAYYAVATNPTGSTTSNEAVLTVSARPDNLALNKPATQSSTGWGGEASRAVDGNTDGVWDNGSLSHTGKEDNPWWQVDLGSAQPIGQVKVWNRSADDKCGADSCDKRLHDFWVFASKKPLEPGATPDSIASDPDARVVRVEGVGGYPSAVDFEGFEAQYIRVTQPGTNVEFALAEVEVSPVKAVAPTVDAITVASTPEGAVQSSGDGAFRTATAPKSTLVSLSAKTTGTPEPGLKWQFRSNDSEEWGDIEDETGDELTVLADEESVGQYRLCAENTAGSACSGIVQLVLAADPAPDPTPDPTPDPGPAPDPTPDPGPSPDPTPDPTPDPGVDWSKGHWRSDGTGWWWGMPDGSYPKDTALTIDGSVYRFGPDGYMRTGWVNEGGSWYFHAPSGAQARGWVHDRGSWYYMGDDGAMATGWVASGGAWYYLTASGAMKTGWLNDGGNWYYLTPGGAMATGWLDDGGTWYYLTASGTMVTGWVNDGGTWYYLTGSGAMATGWLQIGGRWHNFAPNGAWIG